MAAHDLYKTTVFCVLCESSSAEPLRTIFGATNLAVDVSKSQVSFLTAFEGVKERVQRVVPIWKNRPKIKGSLSLSIRPWKPAFAQIDTGFSGCLPFWDREIFPEVLL
jgi:hypothetical protein